MAKRNLRTCGDAFRIEYIAKGEYQNMLLKDGKLISTIYGMQYRNGGNSLKNQLYLGKAVTLKPEPDNPVDPCAIAVYDGYTHLGYIPRKDIPVVMACIEDSGTTAHVDKLDDGIVGIEIEPTFCNLGKRPWLGLSELTFVPAPEYSDDEDYVYDLDEMDEEEFLGKYTYNEGRASRSKRSSSTSSTKHIPSDDDEDDGFVLGEEYHGVMYINCGPSYDQVCSMIRVCPMIGRDPNFKVTYEDHEVKMASEGTGIESILHYDSDCPIINHIMDAAKNGQKIILEPNLDDHTEKGALACNVFIYAKNHLRLKKKIERKKEITINHRLYYKDVDNEIDIYDEEKEFLKKYRWSNFSGSIHGEYDGEDSSFCLRLEDSELDLYLVHLYKTHYEFAHALNSFVSANNIDYGDEVELETTGRIINVTYDELELELTIKFG